MKATNLFLFLFLISEISAANCFSDQYSIIAENTLSETYSPLARGAHTQKNRVENKALIRADEIFHKSGNLILNAKKSVYMQTWHFDINSKPARLFAGYVKALEKKIKKENRKTPVHIWMMINVTDLQNMKKEIRRIKLFIKSHQLHNAYTRIHAGIFNAKSFAANHVKVVSVDGKSAVLTGANMSNSYNGLGYFDLGFVLHGEIVRQLDHDFVQIWKTYVSSNNHPTQPDSRLSSAASKACLPILFTRSKASPRFSSHPQRNSLNYALLNAVASAQNTVDIITPNLNAKVFIDQIIKAVKRGVKVRIVLSKKYEAFAQDFFTRGGSNLKTVPKIFKSLKKYGPRDWVCSLLQVRWYSEDGQKAALGTKAPNSHAKFMVVDGQISYFGTANMDNQSFVNSREVGFFVDSRYKAKAWTRQIFEPVHSRSVLTQECGGPEEPSTRPER